MMFPQPLVDAIGLIFMFVVRIGIPIIITLAIGRWLEKKLAPRETEEQKPRLTLVSRPRSDKVIQLHCWDVKRCDSTKRAQCAAVQRPDLPCWLALQTAGEHVRQECFSCAFYKPNTVAA